MSRDANGYCDICGDPWTEASHGGTCVRRLKLQLASALKEREALLLALNVCVRREGNQLILRVHERSQLKDATDALNAVAHLLESPTTPRTQSEG